MKLKMQDYSMASCRMPHGVRQYQSTRWFDPLPLDPGDTETGPAIVAVPNKSPVLPQAVRLRTFTILVPIRRRHPAA